MLRHDTLGSIDAANPLNREHPLNIGRVAWWKCLPGSGGARWRDLCSPADLSLGNHGTLTSMEPQRLGGSNGFQPLGPPGGWGSVLCDGSAGYVDCGAGMALSPPAITITSWVKFTALTNGYTAIVSRNGAGGYYQLFVKSDGKVAVYTSGGAVNYDEPGTHTLTTGVWYRLAMCYSAQSGFVMYVNGALDGTAAAAGALSSITAHTTLGQDTVNSGRVLAGYLDDVSIWSRALSATEVQADYLLSRQGYPGVLNRVGSTTWFGPLNLSLSTSDSFSFVDISSLISTILASETGALTDVSSLAAASSSSDAGGWGEGASLTTTQSAADGANLIEVSTFTATVSSSDVGNFTNLGVANVTLTPLDAINLGDGASLTSTISASDVQTLTDLASSASALNSTDGYNLADAIALASLAVASDLFAETESTSFTASIASSDSSDFFWSDAVSLIAAVTAADSLFTSESAIALSGQNFSVSDVFTFTDIVSLSVALAAADGLTFAQSTVIIITAGKPSRVIAALWNSPSVSGSLLKWSSGALPSSCLWSRAATFVPLLWS